MGTPATEDSSASTADDDRGGLPLCQMLPRNTEESRVLLLANSRVAMNHIFILVFVAACIVNAVGFLTLLEIVRGQ